MRSVVYSLACVLAALTAPAARALDMMPRSYSRSKQFVVYAKDSALRNGVGTLAEDAKSELLRALNLQDTWKLPIVVDLRAPEPGMSGLTPPVRLSMGQTGLGLKIELDIVIGEASRGTRIRDELVRAMLLEFAYRDRSQLAAGQTCTLPPQWLVEGISAYIENVEDGISATMFQALLPTTQTLPISDFLARDSATMDSTSRGVYRAYAFNLVSLLIKDMEGGRSSLMAFIRDLPTMLPEESRSAGVLGQHFPQLAGTPDDLEKWWTLGLAKLAAADRYQGYTVEETEERLKALLSFSGFANPKRPGPVKTYTINDFEEFTPLKRNREMLQPTRAGLSELVARGNPLSRTIVAGYQEIVETLSRNKTKGVGERLKQLAAERREIVKRRESISDYVNWYEATQMTAQSGAFEEYLHSARQLARQKAVRRPDPISAYLDEMEMEFR